MKKIYTTLFIVIAMFMAIPSQAQVSFGIRGGANLVNMKMSSDVLGSKNNAGFFVGPTVKFTVPIVGLSFDASALYDQRTAKVTGEINGVQEEEEIKQQSIQIPINVRYGWGLSSMANVFLFAGPQFGFNVSKHYSGWTWKSSQFSVNVGVGATVLSHLEIKANYNIVCGKTATAFDGFAGNSRYNAWQLGLAYYF